MPGEIDRLKPWASSAGRRIDLPHWLSLMEVGGQEHDVWEPDDDPLIFKLTKKNAFGLFPHYESSTGEMGCRPALPSEYFRRLMLQNELFADDNTLEGVGITDAGGIYVLTSQPFIAGHAATPEEIAGVMRALDFEAVDEEIGAWILPERRLAVLDALPRNVVRDREGRIVPIDLILGDFVD